MAKSKVLSEIAALDPVRDHQRIVFLTCRCDFPFDTTRALEFALFRTFCVPSIGALLDKTGEFGQRTQKRYDDTDIIVSEIMENGYDSENGKRAIGRMNAIHGRFKISNADFLYVLSTFVFEPIRWLERFGWRCLDEKERIAMFHFWRAVGERMHIREIPDTYGEFETFNQRYEREHFRPNPASKRVAESTMRLFAGWAPKPLQGLVPAVMTALMDDRLRESLELPKPASGLKRAAALALQLRGFLAHSVFPPRRAILRTRMIHPSYPAGYKIESLGPDPASHS